jgi:hypothetical protein
MLFLISRAAPRAPAHLGHEARLSSAEFIREGGRLAATKNNSLKGPGRVSPAEDFNPPGRAEVVLRTLNRDCLKQYRGIELKLICVS